MTTTAIVVVGVPSGGLVFQSVFVYVTFMEGVLVWPKENIIIRRSTKSKKSIIPVFDTLHTVVANNDKHSSQTQSQSDRRGNVLFMLTWSSFGFIHWEVKGNE